MRMPADQLRRMLEQTLIPPINVVELNPDTFEATTIRLQDVEGNLAEQYQLNSCLSRTGLRRLAPRDEVELITEFYLTTAGDGYDELLKEGSRWALPIERCPGWVQRLIGPLSSHPAVAATLFNCDLLVGFGDGLWRLVPDRPGLQYEGTWSVELTAQVQAALPPGPDRPPAAGVILLVGHLARASYLSGDRAFRAAAIGCGSLLGLLWAVLSSPGPAIRMSASQQFHDRTVNAAARCDGVERGVQLVCLVDPLPEPTTGEAHHD